MPLRILHPPKVHRLIRTVKRSNRSAMQSVVYHFTDTARLPFIMACSELRPGRNAYGGFPDPDFLWATLNPSGDRTASGGREPYRQGLVRVVRFTLAEEDFFPWSEVTTRHSEWTPDHIRQLELAAKGMSAPKDWYCRAESLSKERWLKIETKSYLEGRWTNFDLESPLYAAHGRVAPALALQFGNRMLVSTRHLSLDGTESYSVDIEDAKPPSVLETTHAVLGNSDAVSGMPIKW